MSVTRPKRLPAEQQAIRVLGWTERVVFAVIGVILFVAALALLLHAGAHLLPMFGTGDIIDETTVFLDLILLTLMVVELAYTVVLSLKGAVLIAEPFLIVGLIAVIRRILVITVGHAQGSQNPAVSSSPALLELGVLTGVALAFVVSIVVMRARPRDRSLDIFVQDE